MEGFTMVDLQALSINRDDHNNGSFRRKKELVSMELTGSQTFSFWYSINTLQ